MMKMTNERARRERFLSERGFPSKREKRERFLRREEINDRINRLKENLRNFAGHSDEKSLALCAAWRREITQKRRLIIKLLEGKTVERSEISAHISEVQVLRSLARRKREETAVLRPEVR
jgi:hypothetical protein